MVALLMHSVTINNADKKIGVVNNWWCVLQRVLLLQAHQIGSSPEVVLLYVNNMPFHGQDAWRRHPLFTNLWKDPLPGFRPAVIVFGAYMVGEYAYKWLNYQMNAPAQLKKGGGH